MNHTDKTILSSNLVSEQTEKLKTGPHNPASERLRWQCESRGPATVTERTLVVDDDPLIRRTVERILTRAGYEVVTATNVQEAERYANRLPFDAALVDYDLASENGLTVLARLRDLQPSCLRILMTVIRMRRHEG